MFVFLVLGNAPASADDSVGMVSRITGEVAVRRAGDKAFSPAAQGDFLHNEDTLRAGPRSQAAVLLVDGAELRINADSELTFENAELPDGTGARRKVRSYFMNVGQSWAKLYSHKTNGLAVRTPVAVAAVRGTEAEVSVSKPVKRTKKVKVKVKKSEILKKGLEQTKAALKAAIEKEALEREGLETAAKSAEGESKKADETERLLNEARKNAAEAARNAEEQRQQALATPSKEEERQAEQAKRAAEEAARLVEAAQKSAEADRAKREAAEADRRRREETLREVERSRQKADAENLALEEDLKKTSREDPLVVQEVEKQVEDQRMNVSVLEGLVQLYNDFGTQNVAAGQSASAATGAAPEPPKPLAEEQKPKWQDKLQLTDEEKAALLKTLELQLKSKEEPEEKTLELEIQKEGDQGTQKIKLKFRKGEEE